MKLSYTFILRLLVVAFLFLPLLVSAQLQGNVGLLLSKEKYTLSDTIEVRVTEDGVPSDGLCVDLVSPFGEVLAQRRTVAGGARIPLLKTWECGFYEVRLYRDAASPILATKVVPVLSGCTSDSIPFWECKTEAMPVYPQWLSGFLQERSDELKGLLLTKKGKPLASEGVVVEVLGYDAGTHPVWEGTAVTDGHGAFSLSIPRDRVQRLTFSFKDKRGRSREYGYLLLPEGKAGFLSTNYRDEVMRLIQREGLKAYPQETARRRYYYYDMRREALHSYLTSRRIPLLGDWFVSHETFSHAMRTERRAVGWNGKAFSMVPSLKVKIDGPYTLKHVLHAHETPVYYSANEPEIGRVIELSIYSSLRPLVFPLPPSINWEYEGAPRIGVNLMDVLIVLAGHGNIHLLPEHKAYLKPYDPIMVYFK